MFYKSKIGTITLFLLFVSHSALGRPHGPATPVKQLRIARAQVLVRHTTSYCATAVTVKVSGTAAATAAATAITVKFGSATISTASSSSTTSDASPSVASDPPTATASSLTPAVSASSTATPPIPPQPPFSSVGASSISSSAIGLAPSTTSITAPTAALAGTTTSPSTASSTSTGNFVNLVNLQVFTGDAGGILAPAVVASGDQFLVEGNSLFQTKDDALGRSCDVQHNDCADAANASGNKGNFTVAACDDQQNACKAA